MSCHVIYYADGAKRMRPILTAAEYRNLRNNNRQKALVEAIRKGDTSMKHRLMQMNYSCIPSANMQLKGCKMPSMTVGMDVDFDTSAPDYEEKMQKAPQMVLAKKDELGLLMLERSARKGYHIVFRRHFMDGIAEGKILENQEMNLRWASNLLGVKFDEGAKDITRVFFSTTAQEEDLLFLNEELFEQTPAIEISTSTTPEKSHQEKALSSELKSSEENENIENHLENHPVAEQNAQRSKGSEAIKKVSESKEKVSGSNEKASESKEKVSESNFFSEKNLSYNGISFEKIVLKYLELFNDGKLPTEGDRNVKTFELAVTLRSICDYSLEKLEAVIPRFDNFPQDEWLRTLESALKEPRKGMPYRLRQVLAALRQESKIAVTGGTRDTPPQMPKKLPKLLQLLTSKVPQMYKPAVCEGVFPALGVHLHGVKFRYWDNVEHEPTFMNVLIAPMSIGKGAIKKPIDFILADIKEADKPNRLREAEWKRKNPSGKTKAKDPRPTDICIQILIDNLTDAVFNQRVVDAHENGKRFVYTRVDEVEQLKKVTSKGTVDEVSILIRKAFDNAEHGQERVGADSITGIAPLRWNFNASTTIPNAHRFFQKAVNDGTLSRLNLSTIIKPKTEYTPNAQNGIANAQNGTANAKNGTANEDSFLPIFGIYDEKFAEQLQPYIYRLNSANGLIECPQALKLAKELTQENDRRAALYESDAYRILSYRANVIAYLKAMVLFVAQDYKWTKEIADYVRWSEQMDLWCKMRFFGSQLEEEILAEQQQVNAAPKNLLDLLPQEFTYEQFLRMRQQQGKRGDGKGTLRQWKHRGYIEYDEVVNSWHKI